MKINQAPPLPKNPRPIIAIGAGSIVEVGHWPAYKIADFPVNGVFDINLDRARLMAEKFGVDLVYESLEEAASAAPEGAVFDLASPADSIISILEKLPNGSAVLVQKPLGESLAQAEAIAKIAKEKHLTMAVNLQLRYAPYSLAAKSLIDQGIIGTIHEVEVHVNVHMPWDLWTFLEKAPRMEIIYHSIHYLDLVRSFMGEPDRVLASTIKHPFSPKVHSSRTAAILDYGDWARGMVFTHHGHKWGGKHQDASVRIEGDKGAIRFQMGLIRGYPTGEPDWLEYITEGMADWDTVELQGSWFPHGFIGTMGSLQAHLEDPSLPLPTGLDDALKTMALVEACHESSEGRANSSFLGS